MGVYDPLENFPNAPGWWVKHWEFASDEELTEFVVTAIAGGGSTVIDTVNGGGMQILALATTDNCGAEVQADVASVGLVAGKQARWLFRSVYASESTSTNVATESDLWLGVTTLDTSIIASVGANGIYLQKADDATTVSLKVRKGGVEVLSQLTNWSLVAGTEYTVAFQVDPNAAGTYADITVWVNGTQIAMVQDVAVPFVADGLMSPFIAFQTGDNTGTKWAICKAMTIGQQL